MRKITRQEMANSAAQRWLDQYPVSIYAGTDKDTIYQRLKALPSSALANEINSAIGNDSWTELRCTECSKRDNEWIVEVGETMDYESATVHLCAECIEKLKSIAGLKLKQS